MVILVLCVMFIKIRLLVGGVVPLLGCYCLFPGLGPCSCLFSESLRRGSDVAGAVSANSIYLIRPTDSVFRVCPMCSTSPFSLVAEFVFEVWPNLLEAPQVPVKDLVRDADYVDLFVKRQKHIFDLVRCLLGELATV